MLIKRSAGSPAARRGGLAQTLQAAAGGADGAVSRRELLRRSGLAAGGLAAAASL